MCLGFLWKNIRQLRSEGILFTLLTARLIYLAVSSEAVPQVNHLDHILRRIPVNKCSRFTSLIQIHALDFNEHACLATVFMVSKIQSQDSSFLQSLEKLLESCLRHENKPFQISCCQSGPFKLDLTLRYIRLIRLIFMTGIIYIHLFLLVQLYH